MGFVGADIQGSTIRGTWSWFYGLEKHSVPTKWAWKFCKEKQAMWRKFVSSKYGWDSRFLCLHLIVYKIGECSIVMQEILKNLLEDSMMGKGFREQLSWRIWSRKLYPILVGSLE